MKRIVSCIILCFSFFLSSFAADGKEIFVITPLSAENAWWTGNLTAIDELKSERDDINIKAYQLSNKTYNSVSEYDEQINSVKEMYPDKAPDLIVVFGTAIYPAIYQFNEFWPDVPIILVGEFDYICEKEYLFSTYWEEDAKRTKLTELRADFNMTYIQTPIYYKKTVDLMVQMLPKLQKVFFIGGEELLSKELTELFRNEVESRHLIFTPYLAQDHQTTDLEYALSQIDHTTTGVIYTNWLSRSNPRNKVLKLGARHMIEEAAPHFSPYFENTNVDEAVGFVCYDLDEYHNTLRETILKVIDRNMEPRSIPFEIIPAQKPVINIQALRRFNMDESLIPKDAVLANYSSTFWEQNRQVILISIFTMLCITIALLSLLHIRGQRFRKALKEAKQRAEESDRSKTLFVQNMSHDIRTPLNAIIGFSQLLSLPDGAISDEEKREYSKYINNSTNMLMMLVDDILNLAEGEEGSYKIEPTDTPCNSICRSAMTNIEYRVDPAVNLYFTSEVDDDYTVMTDGRRVQQILINYLTNACKHTSKGEIHVHCSLLENPGKVTFSVADTGTGIPKEMQDDLFERFTKHDNLVQGTGLGLNICRTLAAKLNAEVKLDKTYTHGARFVLIINK
ncbi:MAG: HAMP domain-containing histidine kinase [Bacteroidaceae bacterium]|nr:HAMP domain-containing histidine kinase [Bacteroidaceae bacterium]